MIEITPVVKQILIINILFFVGSQMVPIAESYFFLYHFENTSFRFWQPLTSMFMHKDLMHLFFNMFSLFSFGSILERLWGGNKFLFFYISCGLGGVILHSFVNYYKIHALLDTISGLNLSSTDLKLILNTELFTLFDESNKMLPGSVKTILDNAHCTQAQFNVLSEANFLNKTVAMGASAAIYGLLVAFAFIAPNHELGFMFIPIPIKAKYFIPFYMFMFDGFFGIFGSSYFGINTGIGHFAHIGGAIVGFLMMWFWKKNQFNKHRWN